MRFYGTPSNESLSTRAAPAGHTPVSGPWPSAQEGRTGANGGLIDRQLMIYETHRQGRGAGACGWMRCYGTPGNA